MIQEGFEEEKETHVVPQASGDETNSKQEDWGENFNCVWINYF